MKHIIAVLLENEAGALSRVVALFSARGYNIESLTVAPTEDPSLSRMTIVTTGSDEVIEQINNVDPPWPSEIVTPKPPRLLETVAMRCIAKAPAERLQNWSELIRLLQEDWSKSQRRTRKQTPRESS